MAWSSAASRVPHIFEEIFHHMNLKDRLAATEVCPEWEAAILNRSELTQSMALNIVRNDGSQQRLIGVEDVARSKRRYDSIIITPRGKPYLDWKKLKNILQQCNLKCPVKWLRIDGTHDVKNQIIVPPALMTFGWIFCNLQHLELTLTIRTYQEVTWCRAFENFKDLKSLVLCNGHGKALESAQLHCRTLTKLTLKRFALTKPLCDLLDFPLLEELVIDEIDVSPHLELQYGSSRRTFAHLKHLTILIARVAHFHYLEQMPVTIEAPILETAFLTDMLHDFVEIIPGNVFHQLTLNITTFHCEYFLSSRLFQKPATSVSTVIVETSLYRPVAEFAMVFVWQLCPNTRKLIFNQKLDSFEMHMIRSFASRKVPSLTDIDVEKHEFQHRSFRL